MSAVVQAALGKMVGHSPNVRFVVRTMLRFSAQALVEASC